MSAATAVIEFEDGSVLVRIGEFDEMITTDAQDLIRQCFASRRWVTEVVSGRPYVSMRRLISASDDVIADLSWGDLAPALALLGIRPGSASDAEREALRAEVREIVRLRLIKTLR